MIKEVVKIAKHPSRLLYKESQDLLGQWPQILGEIEEFKNSHPSMEYANSYVVFCFPHKMSSPGTGPIFALVGREIIGPLIPGQVLTGDFKVQDGEENLVLQASGMLPKDFSFSHLYQIIEELKAEAHEKLKDGVRVEIDFSPTEGSIEALPYRVEFSFENN
jgi:hypothetical protein